MRPYGIDDDVEHLDVGPDQSLACVDVSCDGRIHDLLVLGIPGSADPDVTGRYSLVAHELIEQLTPQLDKPRRSASRD